MSYALLIDDDVQLAEEMQRAVAASGFELDAAHTWDDGLNKFMSAAPDLVIADYNLPGSRHGLRLLLEIARRRPSVKLVLISAYLNEDDLAKVKTLGLVDDVRRKSNPMETARLVMTLVEEAATQRGRQSDWQHFARSRKQKAVVEADLESLDNFFQRERIPGQASADS